MDSAQLLNQLERVQESITWFDFVARMDELLRELGLDDREEEGVREADVNEAAQLLNTTLQNHWHDLKDRTEGLLLAECYGLCRSRTALEQGISFVRSVWEDRVVSLDGEIWGNDSLVRGYLSSLAQLNQLLRLPEFTELLIDLLASMYRLESRFLMSMMALSTGGAVLIPSQLQAAQIQNYQGHPDVQGLQPGDCLFRELNVTGLRDCGHVGLYLGCPGNGPDPSNWNNHWVIEMTTTGCEQNSVASFQASGKFWGFYGADLTQQQRIDLLVLASSHVGQCTYARFSNYKNFAGMQFRCDGFVEHCHEQISVAPPLPAHRGGGLFEDDRWRSLTPVALRNCLPLRRG